MLRFKLAVTLMLVPFSSILCAQAYPAYRWDISADGSGLDSFAGLGVDAQGNTYIAGSTYSLTYAVKNAAQGESGSAGLFRIDGTGSQYVRLGLISASSVTMGPVNPMVLFASSSGPLPGTGSLAGNGDLMKSVDGGATFSVILTGCGAPIAVVDPSNDRTLYVACGSKGVLKSTDGGATWVAMNNGILQSGLEIIGVWVDPSMPNVVLANETGFQQTTVVRSADGGATWQSVLTTTGSYSTSQLYFDAAHPGLLYGVVNGQAYKSSDHGQTFQELAPPPAGGPVFSSIVSDPNQPGRLVVSPGLYESDDDGTTWTLKTQISFPEYNPPPIVPDWANGFLYVFTSANSLLRISSDLQTVTQVGPPETSVLDGMEGIAVASGRIYLAVSGTRDVFVTKLDPMGNVVYSTYFGGSADDQATAMTVDSAGNAYVSGTTTSLDFPVTNGAYSTTGLTTPELQGSSFLFKLNPDGTVGYSTYFGLGPTVPVAVAVDASGAAYLAGTALAGVPTTAGAFQTSHETFSSNPAQAVNGFGFMTKFDPTGSNLVYSTYIGGASQGYLGYFPVINNAVLAADGSAYVAGASFNGSTAKIYRLSADGSAVLASLPFSAPAIAVAPDGSVYAAGSPIQPTPGAFQTAVPFPPSVQAWGIVKLDPTLATVEAATYFAPLTKSELAPLGIAINKAGNVYLAGASGGQGLPTRTPFQEGFSQTTGFLSELSGDLSTLLFSSYVGDTEFFDVTGLAVDPSGNVLLGGATNPNLYPGGNVYVNSLTIAPPAALRIDSLVSAATFLDGPIAPLETIVIEGTGFGGDAQVFIGGIPVVGVAVDNSSTITAVAPQNIPAIAAEVEVRTGGASSNQVLVPVSSN